MSRSWSELPMSALTLIFEQLYLSDRAGTEDCVARVCSSWAEAAAAATAVIDLEECSNTDSLQRWLHSRGSGVLAIQLIRSSGVITSLPCRKLEDLELKGSSMDLRPGSQLLRDLCAATTLTTLHFNHITFQGEPDLAAVLSALPNLQEFRMYSCHNSLGPIKVQQSPQEQLLHTSADHEVQDSHESSQQLLSTHGDPLDGFKCWTDTGMQLLYKLTKLQLLQLCSLQGVTAAGLAGLADLPELDNLMLKDLTCNISTVPALSQLTGLTVLILSWASDAPRCKFDPSILAHMTQLKWLHLQSCTPARGTAGAAELLYGLSKLLHLDTLRLVYIEGLQECRPEAFSCLTSSSVLENLRFCTELLDRNQPGPWQHMFSNKQQLSALTALRTVDAWTWWPSDLDRLVSSCCNLQYLSMCCSTGLQLTRLLQLTALTQLWAAGVTQGSTTASLVQLSALQGLQDLILMQPCRFADNDAVRSLTALTQLTRLGLSDKDGVFSAAMQQQLLQQFDQDKVQGAGREKFHNIIDTAPDGAQPDVWSQLLSCCEACELLPAASDSDGSDFDGSDSDGSDYE